MTKLTRSKRIKNTNTCKLPALPQDYLITNRETEIKANKIFLCTNLVNRGFPFSQLQRVGPLAKVVKFLGKLGHLQVYCLLLPNIFAKGRAQFLFRDGAYTKGKDMARIFVLFIPKTMVKRWPESEIKTLVRLMCVYSINETKMIHKQCDQIGRFLKVPGN